MDVVLEDCSCNLDHAKITNGMHYNNRSIGTRGFSNGKGKVVHRPPWQQDGPIHSLGVCLDAYIWAVQTLQM